MKRLFYIASTLGPFVVLTVLITLRQAWQDFAWGLGPGLFAGLLAAL